MEVLVGRTDGPAGDFQEAVRGMCLACSPACNRQAFMLV